MIAIAFLFVRMLCDFFKPRQRLEAEILILRHQLNVLQPHAPRRALHLRWIDRALFIWLYRRILPHIQVGKLKPLAIADELRSDQLPAVPTTAESGFPTLQ